MLSSHFLKVFCCSKTEMVFCRFQNVLLCFGLRSTFGDKIQIEFLYKYNPSVIMWAAKIRKAMLRETSVAQPTVVVYAITHKHHWTGVCLRFWECGCLLQWAAEGSEATDCWKRRVWETLLMFSDGWTTVERQHIDVIIQSPILQQDFLHFCHTCTSLMCRVQINWLKPPLLAVCFSVRDRGWTQQIVDLTNQ